MSPAASRTGQPSMKNRAVEAPASRPHPFERPREIPNKGKALAPGGSRPDPPYRGERPNDHHFKRKSNILPLFLFPLLLLFHLFLLFFLLLLNAS